MIVIKKKKRLKKIHSYKDLGLHKNSKVLVCMPHPDDETVFSAGLISKFRNQGLNIRVIIFTRGEKSNDKFGVKESDNLGDIRKQEFMKAMKILCINSSEIYDLGDGNLSNKKSEIQNIIENEISEYQPDILITLEPDGIYGHPDHIAVSEVVSRFHSKYLKVLYSTVSKSYKIPEKLKKINIRDGISSLPAEYILKLNFSLFLRKFKALQSHKSQFNFGIKFWVRMLYVWKQGLLLKEYYVYKKTN